MESFGLGAAGCAFHLQPAGLRDTKTPVAAFFLFFALSSVFCYGATIMLFIPALYCLSKLMRLEFFKVSLLGLLLGIGILFPVMWIFYCSSGPDSGPPEGTFFAYIARSLADTVTWLFPLGGLITAIAYWL